MIDFIKETSSEEYEPMRRDKLSDDDIELIRKYDHEESMKFCREVRFVNMLEIRKELKKEEELKKEAEKK